MNRVITDIETVKGSRKRKIYVNDEWLFSLYPAQVRQHGLEAGLPLTPELYERICAQTLLPQAKKRALNLLLAKERSRRELLEKLSGDGYPAEVCETAVEYAESYHYVDDLRFAVTYLRTHEEEKSRLQLSLKLKEKGIEREVVEEAFETVREERMEQMGEAFEEAELTALRRQASRKVKNPSSFTEKEIQKLVAALYAKGFHSADIRTVLGSMLSEQMAETDM